MTQAAVANPAIPNAEPANENSRYLLINESRDFWNEARGWVETLAEATAFADEPQDLPAGGTVLHMQGQPLEFFCHYYEEDEDGEQDTVATYEEADGYAIYVSIYDADERTDVPEQFHRSFPKAAQNDPAVLAYIAELKNRFADIEMVTPF